MRQPTGAFDGAMGERQRHGGNNCAGGTCTCNQQASRDQQLCSANQLLAAGWASNRIKGRYNGTAHAMATCRGEKGPGAKAMSTTSFPKRRGRWPHTCSPGVRLQLCLQRRKQEHFYPEGLARPPHGIPVLVIQLLQGQRKGKRSIGASNSKPLHLTDTHSALRGRIAILHS